MAVSAYAVHVYRDGVKTYMYEGSSSFNFPVGTFPDLGYSRGKRFVGWFTEDGIKYTDETPIPFNSNNYAEVRVFSKWEYFRCNIDGNLVEDIANAVRVVFDEDTSVTYKPREMAKRILEFEK